MPSREVETEKTATAESRSNAIALPPLHLLVVDDDASVLEACCEIAMGMKFVAHGALTQEEAHQQLVQYPIDIVLLDMKLDGGSGLSLLEDIRHSYPQVSVIVMTAFATVTSAVEAMRIGASDYLTKPFAMEELMETLERAARRKQFDNAGRRLREKMLTDAGMGNIIGRSPEMHKLYRILSKVAFSNHPVLILGESGTGKEVVARTIHAAGPSADKPFVPIDCGSLVPTLIESELFGHVKGAFTGALQHKEGLLSWADSGTIFLDEIGELPLDLQARLLRALQEKEVRPIGSTQAVPIRARVLAATNRDLASMVEQGRFRKDLYFRLNVISLRVPPLRSRREDIPLLAAHFLTRLCHERGVDYNFSDEAIRVMTEYDWPGNVRELENAIERACALSSGPVINMADLPTQLQEYRFQKGDVTHIDARGRDSISAGRPSGERTSLPRLITIAELEKEAILNAIRQLNGDKLMAARMLGIGKTTLYRKLKEYGISDG
ncbi:MAG: sigma-54-dependent Fis family transcriptional regulator [Acidobacteria bacterium]|nr:sigma-54-dependent Fis family transcriptional regulator [Acidobacteriota bacterium]